MDKQHTVAGAAETAESAMANCFQCFALETIGHAQVLVLQQHSIGLVALTREGLEGSLIRTKEIQRGTGESIND